MLGNGRDIYARRLAGILIALIVHIGLLWFLTAHVFGEGLPGDEAKQQSSPLRIIDLMGPVAVAVEAKTGKSASAAPPSKKLESEVNATERRQPVLSEWSVSTIKVQRADPMPPRPSAGAALANAGAGASGANAYDPYAGAAPLRAAMASGSPRSEIASLLTDPRVRAPTRQPLELDTAALDAVRRSVALVMPNARGTAQLAVRVSSSGLIINVQIRGGSAPRQLLIKLRTMLVGKTLFRTSGGETQPQIVALPIITFG